MLDMAFSAASLESYLPIIFMPAFISVTTEHLWVVVSRPTQYVPLVRAKAGVTKKVISTAAVAYFFMTFLPSAKLICPATTELGARPSFGLSIVMLCQAILRSQRSPAV